MSTKIHLVCQIGLGKPLWARVFKACCCNSDYCKRYCDFSHKRICLFNICCNSDYCKRYCDYSVTMKFLFEFGCNSDYCKRYCDFNKVDINIPPYVATVITASGIVTYFLLNSTICSVSCNSDYCKRYCDKNL